MFFLRGGADRKSGKKPIQVLQPCLDIFGAVSIREEEPEIQEYRDAIFLPWSDRDNWGVFDAAGRAIDLAIDYRGPDKYPKQPVLGIAPMPHPYAAEDILLYAGRFNVHFGHFLIDVLPRLWCIRRFAKIKILYHSGDDPADWFRMPHVASTFDALDLTREDFVVFDQTKRIKRIIIPGTSLREHAFAHRIFRDLCAQIGERLIDQETSNAAKIVYLSKSRLSHGVGGFVNEAEIDHALEALGVQILYPETLSLSDHARLFTQDRVVMGGTGSALHVSMFAPNAKIVALNPTDQVVSTYKILDELSHTKSIYVYSPQAKTIKNDPRFQLPKYMPNTKDIAYELFNIARKLL